MSAFERAARALCASIAGESRWERLTDSARNSYRKHARAVLMAVRDASDDTLDGQCFRDMLDDILADGEGR